jgi:hypothetical protein
VGSCDVDALDLGLDMFLPALPQAQRKVAESQASNRRICAVSGFSDMISEALSNPPTRTSAPPAAGMPHAHHSGSTQMRTSHGASDDVHEVECPHPQPKKATRLASQ